MTLLFFGALLLTPLSANMASCDHTDGGTFNCGSRFVCGSQCLTQDQIDKLAASCNKNFDCKSCSCDVPPPPPLPTKTPAYLNFNHNRGDLKIGGVIEGVGGLTVSGTSSLSNILAGDFRVYRADGNNAEIKIQSVAGDNNHWGIYQDSSSGELRFWNKQTGNNMMLASNGDIYFGGEKDIMGEGRGSIIFLKDAGFLGNKNLNLFGGGRVNFNGPGYGSIHYSTTTRSTIISGGGGNETSLIATLGTNNNGIDFISGRTRFFGNIYVGKSGTGNNFYVDDGEIKGKWLHATSPDGESTFAGKVYVDKGLSVKGDTWLDSGRVYVNNSTLYINSNTARPGQVLTAANDGSAVWRELPVASTSPSVTPGLVDVLRTNANASQFNGTVYIGGQSAGAGNLSVAGGEVRAKWINTTESTGINNFAGNILAQKDLTINGTSTLSGKIKISSGAGAGKVLTSDSSGLASWQNLPVIPTYSTPTISGVLTQGADASNFTGNIYFGDATHFSNLYVNGGEVEGGWIHATKQTGTSTFAGNVDVAQKLNVAQANIGANNYSTDIKLMVGSGSGVGNIIGINGADNQYTGIRLSVAGAEKWFIGTDNVSGISSLVVRSGGLDRAVFSETGNLVLGNNSFTNVNNRLEVKASKSGIYSEISPGTFTGNRETDPNLWNRAGHFSVGGTYGAGAWLATTPYRVNESYGVYAYGVTAGVHGYGQTIGVSGKSNPGSIGVQGSLDKCSDRGAMDDCSGGVAVKAIVRGYGTALKASVEEVMAGDSSSVAVHASGPSGIVGIATNANGLSGSFSGGSGVYISNSLKMGNGSPKGSCNSSNVGKLVYEESGNVGHFYGCVKTGGSTYAWRQLDN
mgnify:CR=1 FL=1